MTSTAPKTAAPNRPAPGKAGDDDSTRAAQLRAANINPRTGLATDYLNHFNEAIMLLEMVPDMPECAEDFLGWHPLSYAEHFTASHFKGRDLAISAYNSAVHRRAEFDNIQRHDLDLDAVGAAMREAKRTRPARWLSIYRLAAAGRAGRRHHQWRQRADVD
jgi:hypothetical protein